MRSDETKNITSAALQDGWPLEIVDGAEREVRVEITPGAGATSERALPVVLALAGDAGNKDVARIEAKVQKIAKIQWSRDGQTWNDFAPGAPPEVERMATIGVRAIKFAPGFPWTQPRDSSPKWEWQGRKILGETVWLQGNALTPVAGDRVRAQLGNIVEQAIRVLPSYDVTLSSSRGNLLAGAGPAALKTTTLSIKVADNEDGTPLANVPVRVRALTTTGAATGEIGVPGAGDDVVTTDALGRAQIAWTSGAEVGEVRLEAVPLGETGQPRGAGHSLSIQTNAAYTRIKTGAWTQTGGVWSRPVTASAWFMGQKVAGRALTLTSQIKDYGANQPLAGWQNAAPLDVTSGVTNADGDLATTQRWTPIETGAWPHDYDVTVGVSAP